MGIYILVLCIVCCLAMTTRKNRMGLLYKPNSKTITYNHFIVSIIVFILVLIPGLRYGVGTDYFTYRGLFEHYMEQPFWATFGDKEGAFWAISSLVGNLTDNVNVVFGVHAVVIIVLIVGVLSKFSICFELTLFLYITMMDYFSSFNGMRQWTAAAIIFCGIGLLYKRKWYAYFFLVIVAYRFHNTAIIMIPAYFFLTQKAGSKAIKVTSALMFIIIMAFPGLSNSFFVLLEGSDYQHYMLKDATDDGVNILRVLVAMVPVVMSVRYYRVLYRTEEEQKWLDVLINGSLMNFLVMALALRSTVMARFGMYFSLYNTLLLPYFIRVFTRNSKRFAMFLIIVLFFLYMILLLPTESNLIPYRTIFSIQG